MSRIVPVRSARNVVLYALMLPLCGSGCDKLSQFDVIAIRTAEAPAETQEVAKAIDQLWTEHRLLMDDLKSSAHLVDVDPLPFRVKALRAKVDAALGSCANLSQHDELAEAQRAALLRDQTEVFTIGMAHGRTDLQSRFQEFLQEIT